MTPELTNHWGCFAADEIDMWLPSQACIDDHTEVRETVRNRENFLRAKQFCARRFQYPSSKRVVTAALDPFGRLYEVVRWNGWLSVARSRWQSDDEGSMISMSSTWSKYLVCNFSTRRMSESVVPSISVLASSWTPVGRIYDWTVGTRTRSSHMPTGSTVDNADDSESESRRCGNTPP